MRKKYFNDSPKDKIGFKSKTKLKKDLETLSVIQIAEKYGVTKGAIVYWIKKFSLKVKHRNRQKRKNIKIITVGEKDVKEKQLYHTNPIYKKKKIELKKFHDYDDWWENYEN